VSIISVSALRLEMRFDFDMPYKCTFAMPGVRAAFAPSPQMVAHSPSPAWWWRELRRFSIPGAQNAVIFFRFFVNAIYIYNIYYSLYAIDSTLDRRTDDSYTRTHTTRAYTTCIVPE